MRKSISTLFIVPLIRADVLQYPEKNTAAEKTKKEIHLWQVQGFVWLQTSSQLSVKLGSGRNSKLICELLPSSWQKTPPWIGMSRHVQRQSWKLVGLAQHSSEHPNRQLLASSFLALCLIFLRVFLSASLSSDVFFLGAHVLSSRRTTTRGPLYRKCTVSRVVSSIGLYKGPLMLTKCLHEMFTQQALTFVYGSVHSNSIMSGKPRAQKV